MRKHEPYYWVIYFERKRSEIWYKHKPYIFLRTWLWSFAVFSFWTTKLKEISLRHHSGWIFGSFVLRGFHLLTTEGNIYENYVQTKTFNMSLSSWEVLWAAEVRRDQSRSQNLQSVCLHYRNCVKSSTIVVVNVLDTAIHYSTRLL